jgi:4-hydroxybenzoate polyprenyltransferase
MEVTTNTPKIADATWLMRSLPDALVPYAQLMRLDRPIGWWLLFIPCLWGLLLAQLAAGQTQLNWWYVFLFLAGSIIMRGAGCTINDILDRDIDQAVARTRNRPLASGRVSVMQALVFLALQCFAGLAILLQFNWPTVFLGAASLLIVGVYPMMKRITYYPQFVLGLAFNWGALVGWMAIHGSLQIPAVLLYAAGVSWTMAYDTIYAHQDKEDDALIGVKSTALKFGVKTPTYLIVFFGLTLVLIEAAFWLAGVSLLAHITVAAAALHAAWQVARFDGDEPQLCLKLFRSNRIFGLLIVLGLFLDVAFR